MSAVGRSIGSPFRALPEDRFTLQKGIPTFHPESAEEAATFFRLASGSGQNIFITGFGNNVDPEGARFTNVIALRTDRLNRLGTVSGEGLRVEVGSGYPLREINQKLAHRGLFFPLGDLPYVGSVGGAIAVGLSGQRCNPDGSESILPIKKFVLQLTVATPTGEVKRLGVSGSGNGAQEETARLYSPSWGLFGLIVSATLRLAPLSAHSEYSGVTQRKVESGSFLGALREGTAGSSSPDTPQYLSKVRAKLDPGGILPILFD